MTVEKLRTRVRVAFEAGARIDQKRERLAQQFGNSSLPNPGVDCLDLTMFRAIVGTGGAARDLGAFLVGPLEAQIDAANAADPDAISPNLALLRMVNLLQCVGLAVSNEAVTKATSWLGGMNTLRLEPSWPHWGRGVSALALGQPEVYRAIAGFDISQNIAWNAGKLPTYDMQGWLATFAGGVEDRVSFEVVEPAWRRFFAVYEDLVHDEVFLATDLVWLARIVYHDIDGLPVGEVAQRLHEELLAV